MSIPDQKGTHCSIIDEYGQLTMLHVCTAVDKRLGKSCHNTQNCYQLYTCLLDSITREKFLKVNAVAEQYLLGATKDPTVVCFL
jgi:hypothetical protein